MYAAVVLSFVALISWFVAGIYAYITAFQKGGSMMMLVLAVKIDHEYIQQVLAAETDLLHKHDRAFAQ